MGTKKKLGWDKKFDMIVGPGKKLQTLMARSIIGKLKTPFWIGFDKKMTKNRILHIIYTLESMNYKVLVSVCDQAGENQGNLLQGIVNKMVRKSYALSFHWWKIIFDRPNNFGRIPIVLVRIILEWLL